MDKKTKEISVTASLDNLDLVMGFVEDELSEAGCPLKCIMKIGVCVEEIFVNVASYAYESGEGDCIVRLEVENEEDGGKCAITIIDSGKPFNPLLKEEPDITSSADERQIGGLGIFMVKNTMDNVVYKYESNNILMMEKAW